ncbi:hypothetical protein [Stenotrophomonas maltophilia]|uniref:hypothetical protein n=1 Tax=Stenotrophomonas maltophilia TaxID=40324 RepID=UPI000AE84C6A|nr:hypothetical protein [Stenotrophomonas maltophilia]
MSMFEDLLDMSHVEQEPDYRVDAKGVRCIRRAITFGLHALVQVQKAREAHSAADQMSQPWPDDLRLVAPGESFSSTIEELADALLWIEYASHMKEVRDDAATAE